MVPNWLVSKELIDDESKDIVSGRWAQLGYVTERCAEQLDTYVAQLDSYAQYMGGPTEVKPAAEKVAPNVIDFAARQQNAEETRMQQMADEARRNLEAA